MTAPAIPRREASIITHFQQYVLFSFILCDLMGAKIHATLLRYC